MIQRKDVNKLLTKRFFIKYMNLIDFDLFKRDTAVYKKKLNHAHSLVKGIDFNKNILIAYDRDLVKEVFLAGFSYLDYYPSFIFMGVEELFNYYFGLRSSYHKDNISEDYVSSHVNIKEDVLCLALNYYETARKKTEEIVLSTIISRSGGLSLERSKKTNWLYFYGDDKSLKEKYPLLYEEFLKEENRIKYAYCDLNPKVDENKLDDLYME